LAPSERRKRSGGKRIKKSRQELLEWVEGSRPQLKQPRRISQKQNLDMKEKSQGSKGVRLLGKANPDG